MPDQQAVAEGLDEALPASRYSEREEDSAPAAEITFDEQFYPARPRSLRPRARWRHFVPSGRLSSEPNGPNRDYVEWLRNQSMLGDAKVLSRQLSGQASMWQNPYAHPNPRAAVGLASVWFTAYPLSFITRPNQSFLAALGDPALWEAFQEIGIRAVHTGPVKGAGGLTGWEFTPSVDGHFDRISMAIDPLFGTEEDFRRMCEVAGEHGGIIIDDIVPGHTGKGADFRLAEMNYKDYTGIYHMIDVPESDWHLLPDVPDGEDSVNLSPEAERALQDAGFIIGELQRVIFYEPGVKETNWSATRPVRDTEGNTHRWVYLHYFKAGQPSINWTDPTLSGMRLVMGDALHSLVDLGTRALRLDANGFLGVEKSLEERPGWSEGHPISEAANQFLGSMVRKVGAFTFQELNLSIDDIKATSESGPDLSYDFVTRPAYHHALVTGNTSFLRLTLREAMALGVDQASLVHALQNHDELTYELVHFTTRHKDDIFELDGESLLGCEVAEKVQDDLRRGITGESAPYNRVFTTNGIACTTASVITAALGIRDLGQIGPEQKEQVLRCHLLLAMYNALQPGVFALSGWDFCGVLPLETHRVAPLVARGDTRWINRGSHDLIGGNSDAQESSSGMPKGVGLYGSLTEQLADENSFARRLGAVLKVRDELGIASAELLDVPDVSHKCVLIIVHRLPSGSIQATALNFGGEDVEGTVKSDSFPTGGQVTDALTGDQVGSVDDLGSFYLKLPAFAGTALVVEAPDSEAKLGSV